MNYRCSVHDPNDGQCRARKGPFQGVVIKPPERTNMLAWKHDLVMFLCPKHWREYRDEAERRTK